MRRSAFAYRFPNTLAKKTQRQRAVLAIQKKYGKNALPKGITLWKEAPLAKTAMRELEGIRREKY